MMSLVDATFQLTRFWADQGCQTLLPAELEVPAALFHPDAFFRLAAPGPWRAAYLQPVRRPLDARGGEHPYRMARHLQFQVVWKWPDGDPRELFTDSLRQLGFTLAAHDLRFAEWSWSTPALGAKGFGWRVLVDGLAVARLGFLEEFAGSEPEPPAMEVAYGLERLLFARDGLDDVADVRVAPAGPTWGELHLKGEHELARYVHETADPASLAARFELFEAEAQGALDAGLARPAYELAMAAYAPLDVLAARGELAHGELTAGLGRIRELVTAAVAVHLGDGDEEAA